MVVIAKPVARTAPANATVTSFLIGSHLECRRAWGAPTGESTLAFRPPRELNGSGADFCRADLGGRPKYRRTPDAPCAAPKGSDTFDVCVRLNRHPTTVTTASIMRRPPAASAPCPAA